MHFQDLKKGLKIAKVSKRFQYLSWNYSKQIRKNNKKIYKKRQTSPTSFSAYTNRNKFPKMTISLSTLKLQNFSYEAKYSQKIQSRPFSTPCYYSEFQSPSIFFYSIHFWRLDVSKAGRNSVSSLNS